jgi:dihydropteroate synthase
LSIDTRKAAVARAALEAGADVINDVSGLADPEMAAVAARFGAPLILGHLRGQPATMQDAPSFHDVVAEVVAELSATVRRAVAAGVARDRIVVDPGLGFGKTPAQTVALLAATAEIRERIGCPICVGPSRKSFLGALTGAGVDERLPGTTAASAIAAFLGADFVRVHDVAALRDAITVATALRGAWAGAHDGRAMAELGGRS